MIACLGMTCDKADDCADHGAWQDQRVPDALVVH